VSVDVLYREFPAVAIKERTVGGGRKLSYVEGHSVIHRLNEATGNRWDLSVRAIDQMQIGTQTIVRAHVALSIPGLGTREHIGVQAVADRSGEDLVKGAITDALKKAATLFGVGLHLYGPDYEAGEVAHAAPPPPAVVREAVRSAVKRMPEAGKDTPMVKSLREIVANRGLPAGALEAISMSVSGRELGELTVEEGRDLWSFVAQSSVDDLNRAMGDSSFRKLETTKGDA
jgi:hypothetical protein